MMRADTSCLTRNAQEQASLRLFFATYRRTGTVSATIKALRDEKVQTPTRVRTGPRTGDLVWDLPTHWHALHLLHSPRYAGAFVYGRHRTRKLTDRKVKVDALPRDEWHTLLVDAHQGYITWDEYQDNQRRLREHAQAHGKDRRHSPPREGPALLQGVVLCVR